jgi:hypothetical protein
MRSVQDIDIVSSRAPSVDRQAGARQVDLAFEGLRESCTIADKHTRIRLPLPLAEVARLRELIVWLHEVTEASGLFLQFGPHKGDTLGQVAMRDPDYAGATRRGAGRGHPRSCPFRWPRTRSVGRGVGFGLLTASSYSSADHYSPTRRNAWTL